MKMFFRNFIFSVAREWLLFFISLHQNLVITSFQIENIQQHLNELQTNDRVIE